MGAQLRADNPVFVIKGKHLKASASGGETGKKPDARAILILQELRNDYEQAMDAIKIGVIKFCREVQSLSEYSDGEIRDVEVRLSGMGMFKRKLREIDAKNFNKPVTIRGRVVSLSKVQPYPIKFSYQCRNDQCGHAATVRIKEPGDIVKKPTECAKCESRRITITEAVIKDSQILKITDVRPPKIPTEVFVWIIGKDLCDVAPVGMIVDVFGVENIDFKKDSKTAKPTYRVDANNVEPLNREGELFIITPADARRFDAQYPDSMVHDPDFNQKFIRSWGPDLVGYDDIIETLIWQTMSLGRDEDEEVEDDMGDGGESGMIRGLMGNPSINVLLVGSSGAAKSTMMRRQAKLSPNSEYMSFAMASLPGATIAGRRDTDTGYMMYDVGFFPRCRRGIACGDEFDKMKDERIMGALHEVGSEGTVTATLGGLNITLPADCAWLFGANPKYIEWREDEDIQKNLSFMPPTMITRFDFVYIVLDKPNEEKDRLVARKVLHQDDNEAWLKYLYDEEDGSRWGFITIKKYMQWVVQNVPVPELPQEMEDYLIEEYVKRRKDETLKGIVNPRFLKAMKKGVKARARFFQKRIIDKSDVDAVIKKVMKSLNAVAFDPETQSYDKGLATGQTPMKKVNKDRSDRAEVLEFFEELKAGQEGDSFITEEDFCAGMEVKAGWSEGKSVAFLQATKNLLYQSNKDGKSGYRLL